MNPVSFILALSFLLFPSDGFLVQFLLALHRKSCIVVDDAILFRQLAQNFVFSSHIASAQYVTSGDQKIAVVLRGFNSFRAVARQFTVEMLSRFTWVVFIDEGLDLNAIDFMVPYNCEFYVVTSVGVSGYDITEIYTGKNNGKLYSMSYGSWTVDRGLAAPQKNFFHRRLNLEGYPIKVLVLEKECPYRLQCTFWEIWGDLARSMNMTTELTIYDERDSKHVWDVVLEPMAFDSYMGMTKVIGPIWKLEVFMHIQRRFRYEFSWFDYLEGNFLAVYIAWVIGIGAFITASNFLHLKSVQKKRFYSTDGFFGVLFWMCNQGGVDIEPSVSVLIIVIIFRFAFIILQILCTSILVSFLTLRFVDFPFSDLKGFMSDGSFKMAAINGSLLQFYFSMSPREDEQQVVERFVPINEMPTSLTEAVHKICTDDKLVFLAYNNDVMMLQTTECSIARIPRAAAVIFYGILLEVQSPFDFVFNSIYIQFLEFGVTNRMRSDVYGKLLRETDQSLHRVTFSDYEPLQDIVVWGWVIGVGLLMAEIVSAFVKRKIQEWLSSGGRNPEKKPT